MRDERGADPSDFGHTTAGGTQASEREPSRRHPMRPGAFVRLHRALVAKWLLLLVGIALQWWVIGAVWELVDICISLMELWAELARKHLEITLS